MQKAKKQKLWGSLGGDGGSRWTPEWDDATWSQDCSQPGPSHSLPSLSITELDTARYLRHWLEKHPLLARS